MAGARGRQARTRGAPQQQQPPAGRLRAVDSAVLAAATPRGGSASRLGTPATQRGGGGERGAAAAE
eukprot:scaffold27211_cov63-Phaeocystis_antarctica.AAC.4